MLTLDDGDLHFAHCQIVGNDESLMFWLPMENKCVLFLYLRGDGSAWGSLHYDPKVGNTDASTFTYCYIRKGQIEVETGVPPKEDGSWMFPDLKYDDVRSMMVQLPRLPVVHV